MTITTQSEAKAKIATTLRWLIDHRWTDRSLQSTAHDLATSLIEALKGTVEMERAYEMRWYVTQRWGEADSRSRARAVIDQIIGYPPPGQQSSPPPPIRKDFPTAGSPPVHDVVWMVPPSQRLPIVGAAFASGRAFRDYLAASCPEERMTWSPRGITMHHTAAPSLAQRPHGFTEQNMLNLRSYYLSLGWSRGPHLFVDDNHIWVFSPLTSRGIHAVSFNGTHFGIEMLGNYDTEDPFTGRGEKVLGLAAAAAQEIAGHFGIQSINGHRHDTKTSKTCPGSKIGDDWIKSILPTTS